MTNPPLFLFPQPMMSRIRAWFRLNSKPVDYEFSRDTRMVLILSSIGIVLGISLAAAVIKLIGYTL